MSLGCVKESWRSTPTHPDTFALTFVVGNFKCGTNGNWQCCQSKGKVPSVGDSAISGITGGEMRLKFLCVSPVYLGLNSGQT